MSGGQTTIVAHSSTKVTLHVVEGCGSAVQVSGTGMGPPFPNPFQHSLSIPHLVIQSWPQQRFRHERAVPVCDVGAGEGWLTTGCCIL